MKIKHILLDMDGVLTDFVGHFCKTFSYMPSVETWPKGEFNLAKVLGIEEDHMWELISEKAPGYWKTMPPQWFAEELMDIIRSSGIPFTISTSPSRDPYSAAGKIMWLQEYMGLDFRHFMIGSNKALMARRNVLLIDDYDKNLDAFKAAGGKIAPVPMIWNSYKGDPLCYVKEALCHS